MDMVTFLLLQETIRAILAEMSPREAGIISLRDGLSGGRTRTLEEIGEAYGVTRERIRQIESKTMSKLRHPSRSQVLGAISTPCDPAALHRVPYGGC